MNNKKLVIVQPYIAKYRVAFFQGLIEQLDQNGIECTIAAGLPDKVQKNRGDQVDEPWITPFNNKSLVVAGRTLVLGGARSLWRDADAVIVGLQGTALDTYSAILDAKRGGMAVGTWGHIKSFVNKQNALDAALERWQLRNANHVFAYTGSGAKYALSQGVSVSKLTTVMNTVDTRGLEDAISNLTVSEVSTAAEKLGLVPGKVLAYFGGLDASKRIDFLAATLDIIWEIDKEIRLLLGGRGEQLVLMKKAIDRGQVISLGYVGNDEKALVGSLSQCIVMPGRIGLVAVEALLMKLPIITTDYSFHAPEAEYLVEGVSKVTTENDVEVYAQSLLSFLRGELTLGSETENNSWYYPKMIDMIENFKDGVLSMLS